eukprot:jgi/Psemu1/54956/gm1.54956_g
MVKNPSRIGHKSGVSNYSKTELMELLLHTLHSILPVGPEEWDQVAQIHKDKFPDTDRSEEVQLAKRVKWLIENKLEVGDGEEESDLEEGYKNSMEEGYNNNISSENNISSKDDDSNDDNIPPIPLCQQPLQQTRLAQPTQPTQPTQLPLRQPSQPTQPTQPELNAPIAIHAPAIVTCSRSASSSSQSASSPSPWFASSSPTPQSAKRQYRNIKVNSQEILNVLRENSELEREQRRENSRLKREHRDAVLEAGRQQRQAALESLKAAIIDVATLFVNRLPNSNSNSPGAGDST